MSWTGERIDMLTRMWEGGATASQIADELGGVSRNAVIGKAHRLGLKARPSPVKPNEKQEDDAAGDQAEDMTPDLPAVSEAKPSAVSPRPQPALARPEPPVEPDEPEMHEADDDLSPASAPPPPQPRIVSVGPGGFLRQGPGDQQAPIPPAPPRRLVPAKPNSQMADKTSLLDLNDRICRWPMGHPGEPDFHFCGVKVNPGFPYCVEHCGRAYQAQLPRGARRPPPPLPFGGPRVR